MHLEPVPICSTVLDALIAPSIPTHAEANWVESDWEEHATFGTVHEPITSVTKLALQQTMKPLQLREVLAIDTG